VNPGLTRVTKTAPCPPLPERNAWKYGTPSVVSRADRVAPACRSRACLVDRECHATARTVLTPRRAPAACVSTPCGAPPGQRLVDDSPCGSSCAKARRCFGPTSAISRLRTSTRASWVPDRKCTGWRPCIVGELPGSRQGVSLRRTAPSGFSFIAGGVVFPSPCVRTRL